MKITNENKFYLFWLKSDRGSNYKAIFEFPKEIPIEDLPLYLEKWCRKFGCWEHGENSVQYGHKRIRIPVKKELDKKWGIACKRKEKIREEWKILSSMFNIKSWKEI